MLARLAITCLAFEREGAAKGPAFMPLFCRRKNHVTVDAMRCLQISKTLAQESISKFDGTSNV
jgi:hypothetical protein